MDKVKIRNLIYATLAVLLCYGAVYIIASFYQYGDWGINSLLTIIYSLFVTSLLILFLAKTKIEAQLQKLLLAVLIGLSSSYFCNIWVLWFFAGFQFHLIYPIRIRTFLYWLVGGIVTAVFLSLVTVKDVDTNVGKQILKFFQTGNKLDLKTTAILGLHYRDLTLVQQKLEGGAKEYFQHLETLSRLVLEKVRDNAKTKWL